MHRLLSLLGIIAALSLPSFAFAQDAEAPVYNTSIYTSGSQSAALEAYDYNVPNADITSTIGLFISALLSILGVVFLILVIYAGVLWMTAGGNAENVKKAKAILANAVVGLILTLSSYAIAQFVIGSLS